uniref:Uncharacterized protein n=1 Tax=Salarias fasciatus TaxID=181472 RepID=A0A672GPL8_SALFA
MSRVCACARPCVCIRLLRNALSATFGTRLKDLVERRPRRAKKRRGFVCILVSVADEERLY